MSEEGRAGAGRFHGFDGLRAIAIVLVILWHGALVSRFPDGAMGLLRPLVKMGWSGVDLFFALSGFLITALLLREERAHAARDGGARFSLGRFYARRALRILPVFYAVFLLNTYILARAPVFDSVRATQIAAHHSPLGLSPYATFWSNYFVAYFYRLTGRPVDDPGLAYVVYWSLCVEEHFYLVWPFFLFFVRRWRARVLGALAVCLAVPVLRWLAVDQNWDGQNAIRSLTHYRLDAILWGALGALVHERLRPLVRARRLGLVAALAVAGVLVARGDLSVTPPGTALGLALGLTMLSVAATLALVDLALVPSSLGARVLEARPLVAVGRVSYGMYLVHFQVIDVGRRLFFAVPRRPTVWNLVLSCGLYVLLTFGAAWLLYRLVERPFLRLKDRYFEPR
ncbi:MAG TPA: acyltransferase [Polyangia bacterium]|nr:acyltransferase [Polyangia bacterium]